MTSIVTADITLQQKLQIKDMTTKPRPAVAILLLKMTADENSRTYLDYPSEKDAIYGILRFYEVLLTKKNPGNKMLAYTVSDVFDFIDIIQDVALLSYEPEAKSFAPHGKEYIKAKIVELHNNESK